MIFLLSFISLLAPSYCGALTCLEKMSQELIDPDEANLAASQIGLGQQKIFSSIYPSLYYEMNLSVIDCSSTESMKIMGSDIIRYLDGDAFFSGESSSGLNTNALQFDDSQTY